ncbi:antirestriction protein ArdA [Paremcibacter congregatus]|uniref:antirestriction protein ArdA n=1 Tax=Paremcibacter congregatus TaxID=2043170 RepID=UPI003A938A8D
MPNTYHAAAYDRSASGFYFTSFADYQAKAVCHKNDYGDPVEEFELTAINVENAELFEALGVNQANLEKWFETFEDMDGDDLIKAIYLCTYEGSTMDDVLDRLDDLCLFEGQALDYAHDYIDDCGLLDTMPENLRYYFDYDAFTRDLVLSGDITEVDIMGRSYVVWGC